MRYFLICLGCIFYLNSCTSPKNQEPSIKGSAPEVLNGMRVYIQEVDNRTGRLATIDTAIVMNERFDFGPQQNVIDNRRRILSLDGSPGYVYFVSENTPIEIELDKDSIGGSTVDGDKLNEQYNQYLTSRENFKKRYRKLNLKVREARREGTNQFNKAKDNLDAETKIYTDKLLADLKQKPSDPLGPVYLLELTQNKLITDEESRAAYDVFTDRIKQHPDAVMLEKYLAEKEAVAIGSKAPYFEGRNPDGKIIKLPEVLGKVTLVDFWASWCGPCRGENPNIVAAYEKYHGKGFNVLGVSLDKPGAKQAWITAIEKDSLAWNHISRLAHWNDPIAKQYQVSGIPASFLLDENGVIIDKNLRGRALHDKLASLLD